MANQFQTNVTSLFEGMDHFFSTRTVVGDAIRLEDGTLLLPLVDVSFGVGVGAFSSEELQGGNGRALPEKEYGAGGLGGRITPSAVLVVKDGMVRVMNVRNHDVVGRLVDMVPDLVSHFTARYAGGGMRDEDIIHEAFGQRGNDT